MPGLYHSAVTAYRPVAPAPTAFTHEAHVVRVRLPGGGIPFDRCAARCALPSGIEEDVDVPAEVVRGGAESARVARARVCGDPEGGVWRLQALDKREQAPGAADGWRLQAASRGADEEGGRVEGGPRRLEGQGRQERVHRARRPR
eukprot:5060571-Prymnesium_polylepis.2